MELFTLGADRGYTEHDVREQARALTGFRNDWDDGVGPNNFRFDPEYHDGGVKQHLRQAGPLRLARLVPSCASRTGATRRSSSRSCGRTSSRRRRAARPAARSQRLYVRGRLRGAAGGRGDPAPPALLRGPAHGEAAGRLPRRACCAASGAASTPSRGPGCRTLMGQQLFCPPNVAGWEDDRWLDTGTWRGALADAPRRSLRDRAEDPDDALRRDRAARRPPSTGRSRSGAARRSRPTTRARLLAFARAVSTPAADKPCKQKRLLRLAPERAAHAGRHLPRPPDQLMAHRCCDDFSRTSASARGRDAEASRPDRAPAPPAAGSTGASS